MKTIAELLLEGEAALRSSSLSPRLDASLLLSHATGLSKLDLISKSKETIPALSVTQFQKVLQRRTEGEPVAYIIGKKEFYGRDFTVNSSVLIPRPDTELLVERALALISTWQNIPVRVLELGVGSGCIITTLALEAKKLRRNIEFVGTDISSRAITTARDNARYHGVEGDITFVEGSWFAPLQKEAKFSLIISNPPYIADGDRDVSPETRFEPSTALYAGKDGLKAYREISGDYRHYLSPQGTLLLEMGHTQGEALTRLFIESSPGSTVQIFKDLGGRERVVSVQ